MTATVEIPDILSGEFASNPYPVYQRLRVEAPLMWHGPTQSFVISRFDDVERVFRDSVFTTDNYGPQLEPVHGRTILQMRGREHAVRRALVMPAFRGSTLQDRLLPVIERNAREIIDRFRGSGGADLITDFATRFPISVIADMLGLDQADHPWFHRWYGSITAFLGNPHRAPEVTAAGLAMREEFSTFMMPLIRRRRDELGDDLLSTLCQAEVGGTRMSDEDIKAFCSLLLTAGGETTGKAIGSLFANLLCHPDQLEAVRQDRSLIAPAFAETLRYSPPVHMIKRQAARDVAFSHGIVPAGSTITCLIGAANRDSARYADPDSFNIFRDDLPTDTAFSAAARHLAFATGRHFCVGALLAKAEVEVGTDQLLDATPGLRLANGFQPVEQGIFTRGPRALPVRFTPAR